MARDYKGIYPVLYAYFDKNDRLDRAAMARQVEHVIEAGAHGITVLGLVTEVHKMDVNERLYLVEMVGEMIKGRVPYAVTVGEPSLRGQVEFSQAAARCGADWVILQPPAIKGTSERDLIRFFGAVANAVDIDVAVQNNPVNLDVSLSVKGLVDLNSQHPNISILKGEGYSVDIARVIDQSGGAFKVFGGHGGIEFMSLLRSGGVGLIPAPDFIHAQVRLFELWQEGTDGARAEAERIHREILPAIAFMSRSVPGMLCYGKRLFAQQAGIADIHDRAPALAPTDFGLAEVMRFKSDIAEAAGQAKTVAAE
ncbi:dihydrodipicolinate synthase family protein [Thiosulfatihalobacter marinus]|uniref:dihydrodipicolinate synthase family protein n=1 Tax=Thiosulfatihalobacter marinus TaxID=2792481 RepID=UPI0018D8BBAE|nr:dihydrodipicolinate synthase family protein [Thiosulfatihalobacter marinus]